MNPLSFLAPEEQTICKACGFVMAKGSLRDKCPACGVPASKFEPYEEKTSRFRRIALALDLHPILVHFPQAFTATVLLFAAACVPLPPGALRDALLTTLKVLSIALPFTLLAAVAAGAFDGKIRFRKLKAPMLRMKIYISVAFLAIATANALLVGLAPSLSTAALIGSLALSAGGMACGSVLGMMGVKLLNAKFPG